MRTKGTYVFVVGVRNEEELLDEPVKYGRGVAGKMEEEEADREQYIIRRRLEDGDILASDGMDGFEKELKTVSGDFSCLIVKWVRHEMTAGLEMR